MNKVITISRQFGSGGREIGAKLAEKLGIPFYDNELITRAAQETGFAEAVFANAEKKATNSLLYSIAMGMSSYNSQDIGFSNLSLDDRIYLAQSNAIRKVAEEGPCVIIGRCSRYVLKDMDNAIHLFIHADMPFRMERAVRVEGIDPAKAEEAVLKNDKRRANYYNYHSGEKWGVASNYHLSVDSSLFGIDKTVECIYNFVKEL